MPPSPARGRTRPPRRDRTRRTWRSPATTCPRRPPRPRGGPGRRRTGSVRGCPVRHGCRPTRRRSCGPSWHRGSLPPIRWHLHPSQPSPFEISLVSRPHTISGRSLDPFDRAVARRAVNLATISMHTSSTVVLVLAVFAASLVEMVEALTIVVAAGVSRGLALRPGGSCRGGGGPGRARAGRGRPAHPLRPDRRAARGRGGAAPGARPVVVAQGDPPFERPQGHARRGQDLRRHGGRAQLGARRGRPPSRTRGATVSGSSWPSRGSSSRAWRSC